MSSAPLAGRPPFATDEPDTIYETSPSPAKRRVAPPKPDDPNKRSSAYDVYDNYLAGDASTSKNPFDSPPRNTTRNPDDAGHLRPPRPLSGHSQTSRNSGVGGIGMGLLNMDYSDSEDEDDDDDPKPSTSPASKNAALAAAVSQKPTSPTSTVNRSPFSPPPESSNASLQPAPAAGASHSPPPIAAPRPGYAAPIAALQNPFEPTPSPENPPALSPNNTNNNTALNRMPSARIPPAAPIGGIPSTAPMPRTAPPPIAIPPAALTHGGPIPSMTPAPLQAPATPIMPVFAIPKSAAEKETSVKFQTGQPLPRAKAIMRGQGEDPLLPRRGEKGDDFWRRFSMIAKDEGGKKESIWLRKTRDGSNRLSRWVWVVGMLLLMAIVGASVLGWWFTRSDEPSHTEPAVLAGNTSKVAATFAPTNTPAAAGTSRSVLHVTPTHTIGERGLLDEIITPTPVAASQPTRTANVHLRRRGGNRIVW
ncbi:hypothetical protein CC1G_03356 [Coprinopsis cinerea okayama7|uniref:Uncharacterized protein n=1 Tax=Coprinopsis cinerea (strain Okayama-7 / 130 / ATCC MYA-4618 / FGSC 9003) TaxID=240176 RepID=A8NQY2_COPC7|nr:hypothetical protein CC1G_03356 [Coprinopsis cinerea okayama7\|eukprot:XP_001835574.1 hypothetical protein CC1G_03356 [Coprinopsis cinerea okayama7\